MKEKIIAAVMAFAMVFMPVDAFAFGITELPVAADEAVEPHIWDGTADISWYDSEEPYLEISTPEELAGMAALVNSGATMKGQTIRLKADIYLNDVSHYEDWSGYDENALAELNEWIGIGAMTKIGSSEYYQYDFSGSFDGDKHTIYGMYQLVDHYDGYDWGGLFGESDGSIQKVNIKDCLIIIGKVESEGVGGICALNCGDISYCMTHGLIKLELSRNVQSENTQNLK